MQWRIGKIFKRVSLSFDNSKVIIHGIAALNVLLIKEIFTMRKVRAKRDAALGCDERKLPVLDHTGKLYSGAKCVFFCCNKMYKI
jgi:hypothetical protein